MKIRILILVTFIFSVLIVAILYFASNRPNVYQNGFTRNFISKPKLQPISFSDIGSKVMYIAGLSKNRIYLGNHFKPNQLFTFNYKLENCNIGSLDIPHKDRYFQGATKIVIDSNVISVYNGQIPVLLKGFLNTNKFTEEQVGKINFDIFNLIGQSSFVCRTFDRNLNQNLLIKVNTRQPLEKKIFLLGEHLDDAFSTDGMLMYNNYTKQIIYIYYYRNVFICLDTVLNKKVLLRTIDTVANPHLKTAEIKSEHVIKLLGQPLVVNRNACTYKDKLFIQSTLKSDNELPADFDANIVIDVYDLVMNKYIYSFYLSKFKNMNIDDFRVYENNVITLFGNHMVNYQLAI